MTDLEKIYTLFGLDTDDVSEDVVQYYLDEWATVFPDNDCLVLYNATVSVLEYLIKQADITDATTGTLAQEKEGNVTVTYNTTSDSSSADYWEDILNRFLEDPASTYPSCRDTLKVSQKVFIGGTSLTEVKRVANDTDGLNQYTNRSPYSARTPDHGGALGRSRTNINGVR